MNIIRYIGRDYERYNCFDLAKDFYANELGLTLKNYFEGDVVPNRKEIECLVKTNKGDFEKVDSPIFGDLVVINLYGYSSHIGVCLDENKFLHSLKRVGSCLDSIQKYSKMIEGFYRHKERSSD